MVSQPITLIPRFSRGLRSNAPPKKKKNRKSANNWPSPPKKNIILKFLVFFFRLQKHCDGTCFFFPSTPWPSCGMARRPVRTVEQLWCSYPLKAESEWCVLVIGTTPRNREVRTREKRRMSVFHPGLRCYYLHRMAQTIGQAGWSRTRSSIPGRAKRFFSSLKCLKTRFGSYSGS